MTWLIETLADLIERLRRRPPSEWLLRAVMVAAAAGVQLWLATLGPLALIEWLAWAAIAAAALWPRTLMPLVVLVLQLVWAASVGAAPLALVPVALGMGAQHLAALSLGMSVGWSRVRPGVRRALWAPAGWGAVAMLIGLAVAIVVSAADRQGSALLQAIAVLAVAIGLVAALWPYRSTGAKG